MRTICVGFPLLLACGAGASSLSVAWHEGPELPLARAAHATGWVDGRLVIAGGSYWPDPETKVRAATVHAYDPAVGAWSTLPDLPRGIASCAGAVVEGTFYVIGGFDGEEGRRETLRLTGGPDAYQWEQVATLPRPLALTSAAVVGRRIYIIGGCERSDTLDGLTNGCWALDTARLDDGWREVAPLPGPPRLLAAVATVAGKVYAIGGGTTVDGEVRNLADAYVYDPEVDAWERRRDAPQAARGAAAVAYGDGHLLLLGGYTGGTETGFVSDVWDHDTTDDDYVWAGDLPHAIGVTSFVSGAAGEIYGAGGEDAAKSRAPWLEIGRVGERPTTRLEPGFDRDRLGDGVLDASGDWSLRDGALVQADVRDHPALLFFSGQAFSDFDLAVRYRLTEPGTHVRATDILFRAIDTTRFYYFHCDSQNDMVAFARSREDSFWTEPCRFMKAGVKFGPWQELRVVARGDRFRAYLDGRLIGVVTHGALAAGMVGLGTASAAAEFRDLRVIGTPATLAEPFRPGPALRVRVVRAEAPRDGWQPSLRTVNGDGLELSYALPDGGRTTIRSSDGGLRWEAAEAPSPAAETGRAYPDAPWPEVRGGSLASLVLPNGDELVAFRSPQGNLEIARRANGRWQGTLVVLRQAGKGAAMAALPDGRALVAGSETSPSCLAVTAVDPRGSELRRSTVGAGLLPPASAGDPEIVCPVSIDNPRNTEGSIAELKDGRLLLAYTRFYSGGADNALADISGRLSSDGGVTWSAPFLIQRNDAEQNVMSASLLRLDDGELLLGYLRKNSNSDCRMYVRRSADEGVTWSPEVGVMAERRYFVVNNDRVVQLRSGRLLVPAADHGDANQTGWRGGLAVCYYSDDRGRTWRRGPGEVTLPGIGCQEPGMVELRNGDVYMIIRNSLGSIYRAISSDGGLTWGEPESTGLTTPVAPATIKRIPSTSDLLMVWNNDPRQRVPLTTAISRDEGATWEHVRDLEPEGRSYAYTSVLFVGETAVLSYWTSVPGGLALKVKRLPVSWLDRE